MQRVYLAAVPGALAAAAVLGTGLVTPAAAVECGYPAQPPAYTTVVHPAVTQDVPAVTHEEWLWSRQVSTVERQATRTTPGYDVLRWSRTTELREREYEEKVVDQASVPAVPATPEVGHWETVVVTPAVTTTLWEYLQLQTGNTRWERAGWNAGDNGKGWSATGATDLVVISAAVTRNDWIVDQPAVPGTPEVPEVSHLLRHWLPEETSAPGDWTPTGATRVASSTTESLELPEGELPAGPGWLIGDVVSTIAPAVDTVWLSAGQVVPAGYTETGVQDVRTEVQTTPEHTATPPDGVGWAPVAGSARTVVDQPARVIVVTPATTEHVLISPGVPAGPACPDGDGTVSPPASSAPPAVPSPGKGSAAPVAHTTASSATLLPATGANVPAWVPAAGLLSVLTGVALVRRVRR